MLKRGTAFPRRRATIMCCRSLLLALVPVILVGRAGHAESVNAKERRARTACLAGDYASGVQLLSELFVATLDAAYIYNQGRCFEQSRRYEDAVGRFQEYLRAGKKLTKAEKTDAQKHIDECKELLASERAQAEPAAAAAPPRQEPPVAPASVAPVPVASPVVVVTPPAPIARSNPPAPSREGSGLRTAGIAVASGGVVALVGGVVLNLKVNSLASELKKTDGYSSGKESDRKAYQTLGWVSYGVGAACLVTGAVLYLLGRRSDHAATVVLVPAFLPGQAGAVMKGVF